MKTKTLIMSGGWIVAVLLLGAVVVEKTMQSGDADAAHAQAAKPKHASAAKRIAEPAKKSAAKRIAESAKKPAAEAPKSAVPHAQDYYDEWAQPVFAKLADASAADRVLGEEIMDAIREGRLSGATELAARAEQSDNAHLHMLALVLLRKAVDSDKPSPEVAAELADAAHAFCGSSNKDVAAMSFETFCAASKFYADDTVRRELTEAAFMDWRALEIDGNVELRAMIPDRYAFRDNYQGSQGKGDLGEWAGTFAKVIEGSKNPDSVKFAREYYRAMTQTDYTTLEDAEKWIQRRRELKEEGIRLHGGEANFDAEKWATVYEDRERGADTLETRDGNQTI